MKIILQIPDQTPAPTPKSVTKSAPATPAPEPPAPTPEPKSTQAASEKRAAVLPGNRVEKQPKASDELSSQPAMDDRSMRSFDLHGGASNISDPQRSNPNVFRFVMPKGEA